MQVRQKNNNIKSIRLHLALFTASLGLLFLSSCGQQHKQNAKTHAKANIDYSNLFSHIQGTWISYEYMLNLNKTHSPSLSSAFMEGIFSFTLDSNHLVNDTLYCFSWVNNHEERNLWIAFDSPDSLGSYSTGIGNDQRVLNNDNITRIKIDSPYLTIYTSTFDSVRYVMFDRVARKSQADYPLRHYTTAALFRGEYFVKDSAQVFGSGYIYFDPQKVGRILGSAQYDSFDINVDMMKQNDSTDYMEFFDSRKQTESRSFIYKIRRNSLSLYSNVSGNYPFTLFKTEPADTLPRP
jgi:hypothetical protein